MNQFFAFSNLLQASQLYIQHFLIQLVISITLRVQRMKKLGFIELILGPMFSGKSSEMQRKVRRYQHARKSCLVINYIKDNRYSLQEVVATHDNLTLKALKAGTIQQIKSKALQHDIVAIDEGQFFPDIAEEAENLANSGIIVIIAALDGTFQRKPFGNVLSLVPMAEYVTKLSAVCIECGKQAAFTRRTVDSQQVQFIGGEQAYKPVCRQCYGLVKKEKQQKNQQKKALYRLLQMRYRCLNIKTA